MFSISPVSAGELMVTGTFYDDQLLLGTLGSAMVSETSHQIAASSYHGVASKRFARINWITRFDPF